MKKQAERAILKMIDSYGRKINYLRVSVTKRCNLNCSYCFASQGKYQGDRAIMSLEVGKRALDFLIENSHGRRNLEVDFFGEQLLAGKSTKIEWLKPVFAQDVLKWHMQRLKMFMA